MRQEVLRMEQVTYVEKGITRLENFSMQIYEGEIMGFMPASGHGLSAFLKLLLVNHPLHDGFIYYREELVNSWRESRKDNNRISIVYDKSCLVEGMTVAENIFVLRQGFRQRIIRRSLLRKQLEPFLEEIGMDISPDSYVDTNIKGTLNVLQAARALETERVLITSTSEVYGTAQYVPIDEKHPFQGQSPYSATKIGADRLAESFYRSFNLPVSIVRPFNTYGPRQSARAVIPTIISQLLSGEEETKLGSLTPTRDFNYVKDTVAGFIAIAESDKTIGEEINIATQQEISIGELADEIIRQINPKARIICDEQRLRPEKSEVNRLLGANEKIKRLTDWKMQYTFKQGIRETIEWMKLHLNSYKSDIYNL